MAAKNRQAKALKAQAKRQPKAVAKPASSASRKPLFSFEYVDRSSKQEWAYKPTDDEAAVLLPFLLNMGQITWGQIEGHRSVGRKKHHLQDITASGVDPNAQKDLIRLKLDKIFGHEMFRFRVGSTERLWGYRVGRIFYVVWWDHNYKVYPTEKS